MSSFDEREQEKNSDDFIKTEYESKSSSDDLSTDKLSTQYRGERKVQKQSKNIYIIIAMILIIAVLAAVFMLKFKSKDGDYISSRIDWLESKNPYIQLVVGPEQYVYLLYNKNGEAIAESSYGGQAFYRDDNKLVTVTSTDVLIDTDLNPLSFIKATASIVDNGYGTIETDLSVNEETGDKNMLYTMKVEGTDNIKKIYDTVGDEEYSNTSMEMLLTGFEDVEPITLTLKVSEGQNEEFGAVCSVNFGGGEENEYTSWMFDGYISTFDWGLESGWYSNDTTDVERWNSLSSALVDEIGAKMSEFMISNNLAVSESETGNITAEQFISYTDEERLNTVSLLRTDLLTLGYSLSCTDNDLLNEIQKYIEDTSAKEANILQIGISIATNKGWLVEDYTDGEQVETNESSEQITSDNTTEQATSDNTTEQAEE